MFSVFHYAGYVAYRPLPHRFTLFFRLDTPPSFHGYPDVFIWITFNSIAKIWIWDKYNDPTEQLIQPSDHAASTANGPVHTEPIGKSCDIYRFAWRTYTSPEHHADLATGADRIELSRPVSRLPALVVGLSRDRRASSRENRRMIVASVFWQARPGSYADGENGSFN